MFKKIVKVFLLAFFTLLTFAATKVFAQDQFIIDTNVTYEIQDSGITRVTHDTKITNLYSNFYATTYGLNLDNISPENIVVKEEGKSIPAELEQDGDKTKISISFQTPAAGKGKVKEFSISYNVQNFAVKTGEVWEISIPRLSDEDSFRNYGVTLLIPKSFGREAFITPEPTSRDLLGNSYKYFFNKKAASKTGINAGFGSFQVFSFTLNYHLENPLVKDAYTEIALPPDTEFQKVYFNSLDPKPETVVSDENGNWLARYKLSPRQRIDVALTGNVQLFSSPRYYGKLTEEERDIYLEGNEYWNINDPRIESYAQNLKDAKSIYDFVVGHLKYDYTKVRPNIERLGASGALDSPDSAICMEFTDLFIAIARAAGIPAREVNGFAYTENPDIQPLSLVADVLHSWPEYWNEKIGVWVPIDPTWGSTTKGVDFFETNDLKHFAFVIHGKDPKEPYPPGSYKLGANPQKDVFVNTGKLPQEKLSKPEITIKNSSILPVINNSYIIKIYNPGPTALYNESLKVFFDGNLIQTENVEKMLPFSSSEFSIPIGFSFMGRKNPNKITASFAGTKMDIPSNKTLVIIQSLVVIFIILFIAIGFLAVRLKKIDILSSLKNAISKIKNRKKNSQETTR